MMEKFFQSDVKDVDVIEEFLRSDWQLLAARDQAPASTSLAAIMEKLDHAHGDEIIALVGVGSSVALVV